MRVSNPVWIVVPSLLLLLAWTSPAPASVSAYYIDSPGQLLSGSNADGRLGDLLLENDQVIVVISALGHPIQYAMSGGNVIDGALSADRIDGLTELYTYFDDDWPRQAVYDWLEIVDDGSGGGPAIVRAAGVDSDNPLLEVVTEYSLAEGAEYLVLTTTVTNMGASTVSDFELGDAFTWGACRKFVPGYGYDVAGTTIGPWLAGTADEVSYGYLSPLGDVWGPHGGAWSDMSATTVTIAPGNSALYSRDMIIAGRDVAAVASVIHQIQGTPTGSVDCAVTDQSTSAPIEDADIVAHDDLGSPYLAMETDASGQATTTLPPGDWQLLASAAGYLSDEAWIEIEDGGIETCDFDLVPGGAGPIPIGDTLTVIMRPLVNIPAIVRPGDTLSISCEADPATSGWSAELWHGLLQIPLEMLSSSYDPSTLWWTLSARVPAVSLYELYDLWVTADGGIVDCTRSSVNVIPEYKNSYYFIFVADTHLPTHMYNYESGAGDDTSEEEDFDEVIADIGVINPEFVLIAGDLINEGEMEDYLSWRVFTRSQAQLVECQVPVFLTSGNHDIGGWDSTPPSDGTARRDWWRFFGWNRLDDPPAGAPRYTQNYSFDYGPVHYIGLETYINYDGWRSETYGGESFTSGQLQWLSDDLAAAEGSAAQVLFYHRDFANQINLGSLGVEMALWGHIHNDQGSISNPPYDLATNNVCDGERSYRLVRVTGGTLQPRPTLSAGSSGSRLAVSFTPANDGTHSEVTAEITNNHNEQFEHGRLRFVMPKGGALEATGGTIQQIDDSDSVQVCYVDVDIQPSSSQSVTVTLGQSDVSSETGYAPLQLRLGQNHPNPFNPSTVLSYALPEAGRMELVVYDVRGRRVAVLVNGLMPAGEHRVEWGGLDDSGRPVASGVYLARLAVGAKIKTRKIVLAR